MPTAIARPCPSGPVVASTPSMQEVLRVAGARAAELAEVADLVHRRVRVAGQVEQRVDQHRAVAGREHEAVAVGPVRVGRVELEEFGPQHRGDVGHAHRHARVARVGRLDRVHRQGADGVGHRRVAGGIEAHAKAPGQRGVGAAIRLRGSLGTAPRRPRQARRPVARPGRRVRTRFIHSFGGQGFARQGSFALIMPTMAGDRIARALARIEAAARPDRGRGARPARRAAAIPSLRASTRRCAAKPAQRWPSSTA